MWLDQLHVLFETDFHANFQLPDTLLDAQMLKLLGVW